MKKIFGLATLTIALLGAASGAQAAGTPQPITMRPPVTCGLPCSGQPPIQIFQPAAPIVTTMPVVPISGPIASPIIAPTYLAPVSAQIPGLAAPTQVGLPAGATAQQAMLGQAQARGGQPALGGLVTVIQEPEAPIGAGITIVR